MIEEGVSLGWRVIRGLGNLLWEFGFDLGIKYPGILMQKIFWPPNWFNRVEVGPISYLAGILFYTLVTLSIIFFFE